MKRSFCVLTLLALGLALLSIPGRASAQGGQGNAELMLLQTVTDEGEDGTLLKVFLTLRDRNGDPLQDDYLSLANEGSFALGADRVAAAIEPAGDPIKIALVLDASGSMNARDKQGTPLIQQVREAAMHMIDQAPPNAEFVVMTFADQVQRQNQGFLRRSDQSQIAKDIIATFKINRPGTGDTCLYDAASQAIDALIAAKPVPSERLSVILFTDGKDREAGGKACASTIGAPEVAHKALGTGNVPIPIYTIGVCTNESAPVGDATKRCSNINSLEMTKLTRDTRAFPALGPRDQLNDLFARIMRDLSNQWVAQATICPTAGSNTVLLEVQSGDTTLSKAVPFTAANTCLPPTTFTFSSQEYTAATDSYTVTMKLGSPQRIKRLTLGLFDDADGGTQVAAPLVFDTPPAQLTFTLASAGMKAGQTYYLRAAAVGRDDQAFQDDKGNPTVAVNRFVYNPTLDFQISGADADWDRERLVVAIKLTGTGGRMLTFDGELRDPKTGESEPLAATAPENGKLYMAMPPMLREASEQRDYIITINVAAGGTSPARSYTRMIEPKPTQSPPTPWLLISILGVLAIGAVGFYVIVRRSTAAPPIHTPYSSDTVLRPTSRNARPTQPSARPKQPVPVPQLPSPAAMAGATEMYTLEDHTALATRMARRLRLRVVQTPAPGLAIEQTVSVFPFVLGRATGDLVLSNDPKVSARHLQIDASDAGFRLSDMGSSNGTWVGGQRLQPSEPLSFDKLVTVRLGPNTTIELEPVLA